MQKWNLLYLRKNHFKMLGTSFSSKFNWGSYIVSINKTAFMKTGALICSFKLLSPEVVLYLYKSTILPFMEYCCPVSYVSSCIGLLGFPLLPLLNPCLIFKMQPAKSSILVILPLLHSPSMFAYSNKLHGFLCQFLSLHSQTLQFSVCRMLSFHHP